MSATMTCCEDTVTHDEAATEVAERPQEVAGNDTPAGRELPAARTTVPRIDGFVSEDGYVLIADMPGVDETGVEITLEKNVLRIAGEAGWPEPESFDHSYAEFPRRRYERTLRLSDEVDRGGIEATVRNGVLRLTLPKTPESKPTRIAVTAGA